MVLQLGRSFIQIHACIIRAQNNRDATNFPFLKWVFIQWVICHILLATIDIHPNERALWEHALLKITQWYIWMPMSCHCVWPTANYFFYASLRTLIYTIRLIIVKAYKWIGMLYYPCNVFLKSWNVHVYIADCGLFVQREFALCSC